VKDNGSERGGGGETDEDEDEAEKLAGAKAVIAIAPLCLLLLFCARRSTGSTKRVLVSVVQGPGFAMRDPGLEDSRQATTLHSSSSNFGFAVSAC